MAEKRVRLLFDEFKSVSEPTELENHGRRTGLTLSHLLMVERRCATKMLVRPSASLCTQSELLRESGSFHKPGCGHQERPDSAPCFHEYEMQEKEHQHLSASLGVSFLHATSRAKHQVSAFWGQVLLQLTSSEPMISRSVAVSRALVASLHRKEACFSFLQ